MKDEVDLARAPTSGSAEEGAVHEPPSPQTPVCLKVESKAEGSEERRGSEHRTGSASSSSLERSRLDTSPASHAFADPLLGLAVGASGSSGSSGDSSNVSSGGSVSSSNSSERSHHLTPAVDDSAAAAHARAVRAIAASGLNVPEADYRVMSPSSSSGGGGDDVSSIYANTGAPVSPAVPREQAILLPQDHEDLNAIDAFIDEPLAAEPFIGPRDSSGGTGSWPGGASDAGDDGSSDATTATPMHGAAAAAAAAGADYGDSDDDGSTRKADEAPRSPTSSPEDKEDKHHRRVAAGAAALFVMGTMTAGAAVAAVAVGGGVAGYYHRRREKEREKERKANDEAFGSSNSSSSSRSNEKGCSNQLQEGSEGGGGVVGSRSGAAAADDSEASAPKVYAKPYFRRRSRRGKSPVYTERPPVDTAPAAIVNPVVSPAYAEETRSV